MTDNSQAAGSLSRSALFERALRFILPEAPWVPLAAAVTAFGVDTVSPRAIVDFYLIPILMCLRARWPRAPLYTAALSTPLMGIGYFVAPQMGSPPAVALINRVSALLVVWVGAMMIARTLTSSAAAKEAQARAWSSERRFRVMADGVPAMIWVTNAQGGIEFVNREYCTFFGLTLEQAQRDWQTFVHPKEAESYLGAYFDALAMQTHFHARARVRHASGAWRWIESSGVPRFSETGAFLGLVGLSPDVTATVQAQRDLEEADRRKDQFLAMLSHELRNPLTPIRNAAEILATAGVTPDRLQWASGMIRRQAARMSGLLEDLFDVARIAEGKFSLSLQSVSLASVMDAAIEVARPSLEQKSQRLTVSLPVGTARIRADPLRLSQVFSNLLTNAAKYTDPGGHIELSGGIDNGMLRVSVKDNGIGIPAEALTAVFGLFSQVDGATGHGEGGMGIGLALAKAIVELHEGTIEALSEGRGHGSEFIVRLPLAAEEPGVNRPSADEPTFASADGSRILIADDNKDAADSLAMILTIEGHEVRVAYDGCAALSLAQAFRPETALLDIGMPGLDGYAVAEALRKEPGGAHIFLVALTGWGNEDDKLRAKAAGFDAHLTKPVEPERIKSLLRARKQSARSRGETHTDPP